MGDPTEGPWGNTNDPWQRVIDEGLEEKVPKRRKDEERDKFISRCMGDPEMRRSFPKQDQRFAICRRAAQKQHDEAEETND